jgi:hypothetical protein
LYLDILKHKTKVEVWVEVGFAASKGLAAVNSDMVSMSASVACYNSVTAALSAAFSYVWQC